MHKQPHMLVPCRQSTVQKRLGGPTCCGPAGRVLRRTVVVRVLCRHTTVHGLLEAPNVAAFKQHVGRSHRGGRLHTPQLLRRVTRGGLSAFAPRHYHQVSRRVSPCCTHTDAELAGGWQNKTAVVRAALTVKVAFRRCRESSMIMPVALMRFMFDAHRVPKVHVLWSLCRHD